MQPSIRDLLEHIISNQERMLYKMAELTEQFKSDLDTLFTGVGNLSTNVGDLSTQINTVKTEITEQIQRLTEAAQGGGDFTAEAQKAHEAVQKLATVEDALQSVKTGLQALDDLNPNTTPGTEPGTGETVDGGAGSDTLTGSAGETAEGGAGNDGGVDANGNPVIGSEEG